MQSNFFRQIRNFVLDITNAPLNAYVAALHWQVAQATSLQSIKFVMSTVPGNNQQGIFMENGSSGFMSDLEFEGGTLGAYVGNQQFTVRNLKFRNHQTRAIEIHWDWGWTWKGLDIRNTPIAIMMSTPKDYTEVGSAIFIDSVFENCGIGIELQNPTQTNKISLSIFNLRTVNVPSIVKWWQGGATLLAWGIGKRYDTSKGETSGVWQNGENYPPRAVYQPAAAQGAGPDRRPVGLLRALQAAVRVTCRVGIRQPQKRVWRGRRRQHGRHGGAERGANRHGEKQQDPLDPRRRKYGFRHGLLPQWRQGRRASLVTNHGLRGQICRRTETLSCSKVGNPADIGIMEIQDVLFTVRGATAGAIILQWNIAAETAGAAAMWDVHVRVGGAAGSNLQVGNCPKHSGTVNRSCMAAAMLVHLTAKSSAYFENTWFWVADHDLDIPAQTQIDIYVGRGTCYNRLFTYFVARSLSLTLHPSTYRIDFVQLASPAWHGRPDHKRSTLTCCCYRRSHRVRQAGLAIRHRKRALRPVPVPDPQRRQRLYGHDPNRVAILPGGAPRPGSVRRPSLPLRPLVFSLSPRIQDVRRFVGLEDPEQQVHLPIWWRPVFLVLRVQPELRERGPRELPGQDGRSPGQ